MSTEEKATVSRLCRLVICVIVALALYICAGEFARAQTGVTASASIVPGDFLGPGEATLTVELINNGASAAEGVRISPSETQAGEAVESVPPGATMYYAYAVSVTQKILDSGKVDVYISYQMDGKAHKLQAQAAVKRVSSLASASLTRRIAQAAARAGDYVEIAYRAENTGEIPIIDARVIDAMGGFVSEAFSLSPGESIDLTAYAAISETVQTTARLVFTSSESGTVYTQYAQQAEIRVETDGAYLYALPEAQYTAYGERATITLRAENAGGLSYGNLSAYEPVLGRILGMPYGLDAKGAFEVEVTTPPVTEDAEYVFTLSMRDSSGALARVTSAPARVYVQPGAYAEVSLRAEAADCEEYGEAAFTLYIQGAGENIKNLSVCEETRGELRTLSVLCANVETVLTLELEAESGEELRFYVRYDTVDGARTARAQSVYALAVTQRARGARGQAALYALVQARALPTGVLIVCASAATIIALALLARAYVLHRRRKRARQAELGRTNKFAPVRVNGSKENE